MNFTFSFTRGLRLKPECPSTSDFDGILRYEPSGLDTYEIDGRSITREQYEAIGKALIANPGLSREEAYRIAGLRP